MKRHKGGTAVPRCGGQSILFPAEELGPSNPPG